VHDAAIRYERNLTWLKRWIWIYFWLLIFEGSLRKWAFPSLSGPLLLVRDPVAAIVYLQAYRCGKLSMKTMWPLGILALTLILLACAQVAAGIDTLPIALYGLRSYLLHLPLIFIMAVTLEERDVRDFGRWIFLLMIPMTVLVLLQYRAGESAWINAGAGEGAAQIIATGTHIRPAGTFSYGVGMQCFAVLAAAFLLEALTGIRKYPRWLIYSTLFCTIACAPMLGSRTVFFNLALLTVFLVSSGLAHVARMGGLLKIGAAVLLAVLVTLQFSFFQDALGTFSKRWQQAQHSEGDVVETLNKRVFDTLLNAVGSAGDTSLLGRGIGMGSNYAAVATTGERNFLLGEGEWGRVIPEMGPIFGLLFMAVRSAFVLYLLFQARQALARNSALSWLLVPTVAPLIIIGVMEQATYLGFMVFISGLCLAAARFPGWGAPELIPDAEQETEMVRA
jgi:hypothetical protein